MPASVVFCFLFCVIRILRFSFRSDSRYNAENCYYELLDSTSSLCGGGSFPDAALMPARAPRLDHDNPTRRLESGGHIWHRAKPPSDVTRAHGRNFPHSAVGVTLDQMTPSWSGFGHRTKQGKSFSSCTAS